MQGARRFEFCFPVTVIVNSQLRNTCWDPVNAWQCSGRRNCLWLDPVPVLAGTPVKLTVFLLLSSLSPGKCQTVNLNYATISSFLHHSECIIHCHSFSRQKCCDVITSTITLHQHRRRRRHDVDIIIATIT